MSEPTIADVMLTYAENAVDWARERFNVNLDFSEGSLEKVESILDLLYEALPKGKANDASRLGPSQEKIAQMAKGLGAYVGEVIRRLWGGTWKAESVVHAGRTMVLEIRGMDIFPASKVYQRLINGPEDNIWHYYQVIKQELERPNQRPI